MDICVCQRCLSVKCTHHIYNSPLTPSLSPPPPLSLFSQAAVRANIVAGGDNALRAWFIGSLLAAEQGRLG